MARAPLVLSAHAPAWRAERGQVEGKARPSDGSCQFCGLSAAGWQERPVEDDASCALCHLSLHLERPTIDREAVLIWLPEMAQGALNILLRNLQLVCHAAGVPSRSTGGAAVPIPENAHHARIAFEALLARREAAGTRLGTTSPRELGTVLLGLSRLEYETRSELLAGTRLLGLGALFDQGGDIYPSLLTTWAQTWVHSKRTAKA